MSESLVEKLLESFDQLENCIKLCRQQLSQKHGVPSHVVERVNQYSEIVAKQRTLAVKLREHLTAENWEEVGRHVKLINGLSSMIRDDAKAILLDTEAHETAGKDTFI